MKPGRELDALVAEKVMGWKNCNPVATWDRWEYGDPGDDWTDVENEWCRGYGVSPYNKYFMIPFPRYSVNIADAWAVVEKMQASGFHYLLFCSHESGLSAATFYLGPADGSDDVKSSMYAPHAICLAALKAVGVDLENP